MRRVLALMGGFLLSLTAIAATGNLGYTIPTARADGTPMSVSEIDRYNITCTYQPAGGATGGCQGLAPTSFPGSSNGGVVSLLVQEDGQVCFSLRTVDTGGRTSDASNVACKGVAIAPPNPPGNVVVAFAITIADMEFTIDPVPVYGYKEVFQRPLGFVTQRTATVLGFALAGTPCYGDRLFSYRGQDYYRVAQEGIGWWGVQPTEKVAAPCSGA